MNTDRVIPAQIEEMVQGHGLSHVILGMHLKKAKLGPGPGDARQVWRAQADTCAAARSWPLRDHGRYPARCLLSSF